MGFVPERRSRDVFDQRRPERVGAAMARRVGEELREEAAERTPVAGLPPSLRADEFIERRGGRTPGTLKRNWRTGPVRRTAEGHEVAVENPDPVGILVEEDTRPHLITAKGKALRFPGASGGDVFAQSVKHPGTQGVHMLRDATALLRARLAVIGREELDRDRRERP